MLFHHGQGQVLRHTLHGGRPRPRTVHRSHNEVVGDKERPTKIVRNCTRVPGLLLAVLVRFTVKEPPRGYSEQRVGENQSSTLMESLRI